MTKKEYFKIFGLTSASQAQIKIRSQDILYKNSQTFLEEYIEGEIKKEVDLFNEKNRRRMHDMPEVELSDFTSNLSDYYGLSHESKDELSNYMLVATYSAYEKGFKKIMSLTGKFTAGQIRDCYKINKAKALLKSKFNIEYSNVLNCDKIEEIRCLNNDIKHNGTVGSELVAANNKWVLDEEINNTYKDFQRLFDGPYSFLLDLVNKIEPNL